MSDFGRLMHAEWTKLRSVRRWLVALLAAAGLTIGFSMFVATTSRTDANRFSEYVSGPDGNPVSDDFHFTHRPLIGDGSVAARVVSQSASHPDAGAGVMIKDGTRSGSPYVAVMLTPGHGVRLGANYTTDRAGGSGGAPRFLRLTRAGDSITGYESADGTTWRKIGTVRIALPATAEVGIFVSSPLKITIERQAGSTSVGGRSTSGKATFDNVRVDGAPAGEWQSEDIGRVDDSLKIGDPGGDTTEAGGVFTLTGSGKIGPNAPDDDVVQLSLLGVLFGLMALIAVGVLFMTAEYKRGMIRTTFATTGGRARVLAAKAAVLGAAAFAIGMVSCFAAFFLAQPVLRGNGFTSPAFPEVSLADGPVLRAVVGSAVFMALVAVFSLGVGAILRRSAGAITLVILLIVLPTIIGSLIPVGPARALMHITPAGGFAVQRAKPPTETLVDPFALIGPFAGLGVASAYAAGALLIAAWLVRTRDA